MDLVSGTPFWPLRNGLLETYPPLTASLDTEVVVLGGGVTGALVAWQLSRAGLDVVVLDRRDVASGSSAASTGLLQYEIDTPLRLLARTLGEARAVRAYQVCRDAVRAFAGIARRLDRDLEFAPAGSLQGASRASHVAPLRREFELRRRHGFEVDWWGRREVARASTLPFFAALLTPDAGAIDTHRLTHALLREATRRGARVFDRTRATRRRAARTGVEIHTARGPVVKARHLVVATGYETEPFLPDGLTRLIATFALVTEPLAAFPGWPAGRLIWETARPYTYLRRTGEGRILVGGADAGTVTPERRNRLLPSRIARLARRLRRWLPRVPFEIGYSWAATFAETPDGLPYIGRHPRVPRAYFALGYGGNGIPFSLVASEMIRDLICEGHSRDEVLFSFDRAVR